jgi:hypothetical protein
MKLEIQTLKTLLVMAEKLPTLKLQKTINQFLASK